MKATFLDRAIATISPGWAVSRLRARMAWNSLNSLSESDDLDRLKRTRRQGQSADQRNQRSAIQNREQARWLEETFDIAKGVLDVLETNIIGSGIFPEPQVKLKDGTLATEINDQLRTLFDDWIHAPEVTGKMDYATVQSLMCRAMFRDGEIFAQHLAGPVPFLDHQTIVPYSIEVLEADFVPYDLMDEKRGIFQGVEMNAWGRPRAYHVYRDHPGDAKRSWNIETKKIPADRFMHLMRTTRFHSTRGMSEFASVMSRFGDLKEIDESERVAMRVAAAMTAYIKKGDPAVYQSNSNSSGTAQAKRLMQMSPGMIFDDLRPGEDVGIIQNTRANNNLAAFRNAHLASAASGTSTGRSSISKDYSGSYSSQRQELVEQYAVYRRLSGIFIMRLCQPVWDNFVTASVGGRLLKGLASVDMQTIYDVQHTPPAMPWIDPVKEAEANDLLERRRFKSRPAIIREMRQNPDQVNREIERDRLERERLKIVQEGESAPGVPLQSAEDPSAQPNNDPNDPTEGSEGTPP